MKASGGIEGSAGPGVLLAVPGGSIGVHAKSNGMSAFPLSKFLLIFLVTLFTRSIMLSSVFTAATEDLSTAVLGEELAGVALARSWSARGVQLLK